MADESGLTWGEVTSAAGRIYHVASFGQYTASVWSVPRDCWFVIIIDVDTGKQVASDVHVSLGEAQGWAEHDMRALTRGTVN